MLNEKMEGATLRTLYRIAKHPTKGVRPFFTNPHAMIALRPAVERITS